MKFKSLTFLLACFLISCGGASTTSNEPSTSQDLSDTTSSEELTSFSGTLMEKNNAYLGIQKETLELSNSINLKNKYYLWYFDLGTVRNTPIFTSLAIPSSYNLEMEFTFDRITSNTFSNAHTSIDERINTNSTTQGVTIGFEKSVSHSVARTAEVEASQPVGIASLKVSAGITTAFAAALSYSRSDNVQWTSSWGNTITNSESVTESYVEQYSEGFKIKLNIDEEHGFLPDYMYRVSFYETTRVYGVLTYDVENDHYYASYENFIVPNQKQLAIERSKTGLFDYENNNILTFNIDEALEIAKNNIPTTDYVEPEIIEPVIGNIITIKTISKMLCIDLSSFQESGSLSGFEWDWYQNGTLIINPMVEGHPIYGVEIKAAYSLQNPKDGRIFDKTFDNLSIQFADHWDKDPFMMLNNIAFNTPNNKSAIYCEKGLDLSINGKVQISVTGNQKLDAVSTNGDISISGDIDSSLIINANNTSTDGSNGICCKALTVSNLALTVNAGDGANGNDSHRAGYEGGIAINVESFVVDEGAKVVANGGSGGSGRYGNGGFNSEQYNQDWAQKEDGTPGEAGSAGGNGGIGIKTKSFVTNSNSNVIATGGNGGNGGNGGRGGKGRSNNTDSKRGDGKRGGDGGDGGIGNSGIYALTISAEGQVKSIAGIGGDGGNGAQGGSGGDNWWLIDNVTVGNGGNGGNGGRGGDSIAIIIGNGDSSQFTLETHPGNGGSAGAAGPRGTSHNASIKYGSDGYAGFSGANGNSISVKQIN